MFVCCASNFSPLSPRLGRAKLTSDIPHTSSAGSYNNMCLSFSFSSSSSFSYSFSSSLPSTVVGWSQHWANVFELVLHVSPLELAPEDNWNLACVVVVVIVVVIIVLVVFVVVTPHMNTKQLLKTSPD